MLLSVVVPAHNAHDYLARCVRSLLDQDVDKVEYEILVIDDGSADDTLAIAEALAAANDNVVVHSQKNQGVGAARNAGIDLAAGKYVYFVDSDDHVASRVLAGLIQLMEREGLQVLAFRHSEVGPDELRPLPRTALDPIQAVAVTPGTELLARYHYPNGVWWYILNRAFLVESGMRFEAGRLVEDALFTAGVMSAASRAAFVPVDVYRYAQRPGSIMRATDAAHTTRLIGDYEHNVFGLEELRQRCLQSGTGSNAFLDRLVYRQHAFVFFLISRVIRSDLPARPLLPDVLERLRMIDRYPLKQFPGRDYRGIQYRLLTFIYNRGYLLYPFVRAYRSLRGLARAAGRS